MKNRKREICTSGSVTDEDGQPPHLLGRRKFLHLVTSVAALPAVSRIAWAQAYPSRPVRVIVPFAPAGSTDILARLIGQWLSERLGQPFVIENRPGASTMVGTEAVVRSPADGYTFMVFGTASAINVTLYENRISYDFLRDIAHEASQPRYGFARAWSSVGSQRSVQIVRRANQGEMGESLGEVSQGLAAMPGLFRIEADMVGEAQHPLENQSRFLEPRPVVAAGSGQRLDQPKRADVEGALLSG
jgi:hypothetical protein